MKKILSLFTSLIFGLIFNCTIYSMSFAAKPQYQQYVKPDLAVVFVEKTWPSQTIKIIEYSTLGGNPIESVVTRIPNFEDVKKLDMTSIVCTKSPSESAMVAKFGPDYIAVEPPELIGSGRSVTKAKPQVITKTIEQVLKIDKIPVLCGAGIVNGEDVKKALELGAEGILIASAVMKAQNPKNVLMDLCTGFD